MSLMLRNVSEFFGRWQLTHNAFRGKLSPKRSSIYKGKGCRSLGFHTRRGGYVLQDHKLPVYEVPDVANFELTPYVARIVAKK